MEFRGEKYNLSGIVKFREDADRQTRHDAECVRWQWFADNRPALDRIFDDLVQAAARDGPPARLRELHRPRLQADEAGRLQRRRTSSSSGPKSASTWCRWRSSCASRQAASARRGQADVLGRRGPRPAGQSRAARRPRLDGRAGPADVRRHASATWASFFRLMREAKLTDLKNRDGKSPGGFCTSFPTYGLPFIFANFNGTKHDVEVFTHEMGHAYQGYSEPPPAAARLPVADVRIVRDPFDGPGVPHLAAHGAVFRGRRRAVPPHSPHAGAAVHSLRRGGRSLPAPGLCAARSDAGRAACDVAGDGADCICPGATTATCRTCRPAASGSSSGTFICSPFYYIDYTLAQTCALQLWVRAQKDPRRHARRLQRPLRPRRRSAVSGPRAAPPASSARSRPAACAMSRRKPARCSTRRRDRRHLAPRDAKDAFGAQDSMPVVGDSLLAEREAYDGA